MLPAILRRRLRPPASILPSIPVAGRSQLALPMPSLFRSHAFDATLHRTSLHTTRFPRAVVPTIQISPTKPRPSEQRTATQQELRLTSEGSRPGWDPVTESLDAPS